MPSESTTAFKKTLDACEKSVKQALPYTVDESMNWHGLSRK